MNDDILYRASLLETALASILNYVGTVGLILVIGFIVTVVINTTKSG